MQKIGHDAKSMLQSHNLVVNNQVVLPLLGLV